MTEATPAEQVPGPGEDLFRLLVGSIRDYAIFLLDAGGHVASWNEGARRIKGYEPDEILGKHFAIFYPPQEVRRGKPEYELRVAADEGRWEEEGWRVRKDGSRFWASVVVTAVRDGEGRLVGFAKVTRDLTERRHAEEQREQLLAHERAARAQAEAAVERLQTIQKVTESALAHLALDDLLRELLDRVEESLAVDTVAVLLLEGDVVVARAAKGLEEEVERGVSIPLGKGFAGRIVAERRSIIIDDVDHADVLNPLLREKGVKSLLGVPLLVEGKSIGVLHVGTLYHRRFTKQETRFLQVVSDRVALAIERARLYEAERRARQAREEFLAVAAHELKTPLTSLRAATQLLMRLSDGATASKPRRLRQVLETINRQTDKLSRMVIQLLEIARLESGRLTLDRQVEDITSIAAGVVEDAQTRARRHEIVLSGEPRVLAPVDALRLEQVLDALIDNAIKYSPEGGRVDVEVTTPDAATARLTVRDHGIGIPPEDRPHVFERFHQAHADSHRSGLGLGLYITREIVQRHGGRIEAESPPDGGTRVVVTLPTDPVAAAVEPAGGQHG